MPRHLSGKFSMERWCVLCYQGSDTLVPPLRFPAQSLGCIRDRIKDEQAFCCNECELGVRGVLGGLLRAKV